MKTCVVRDSYGHVTKSKPQYEFGSEVGCCGYSNTLVAPVKGFKIAHACLQAENEPYDGEALCKEKCTAANRKTQSPSVDGEYGAKITKTKCELNPSYKFVRKECTPCDKLHNPATTTGGGVPKKGPSPSTTSGGSGGPSATSGSSGGGPVTGCKSHADCNPNGKECMLCLKTFGTCVAHPNPPVPEDCGQVKKKDAKSEPQDKKPPTLNLEPMTF